jgi:hypothetical protein
MRLFFRAFSSKGFHVGNKNTASLFYFEIRIFNSRFQIFIFKNFCAKAVKSMLSVHREYFESSRKRTGKIHSSPPSHLSKKIFYQNRENVITRSIAYISPEINPKNNSRF